MAMKAQAAMEYLMTYGWAILIVIIVAAALYALGVFNPSTWTGDRATGFTNIGAPASGAWKVSANTPGNFQVNLRNNLPSRINITSATSVTIESTTCDGLEVGGVGLLSAETTVGIGNTFNITANCTGLTAGSAYTASVKVVYDNLDTGIDAFTDSGTLTGTVGS